ncbi:uncharacterized protein SOCEGT47_074570 [Sorangium cellulosum]|uniref:Uncharacterized protein n=1 Tax=Sorangium cellulosum TaxID=56 RepID=A0A4P2QB38_SORCE|nr:hypothetical protein [Sorangium cellulosum]AUX26887.1 uncharacterized protein SOCEGT47_074570 [Sorangium cellulosum]
MSCVRVLPFAMTQVDDRHACVGSLTEDGRWVRPEPVTLDMVDRAFVYRTWTELALVPSAHPDARPEDRAMLQAPRPLGRIDAAAWKELAERHLDPDVLTALGGERSLGLVKASIERLYLKRSTGGRRFVRMVFTDRASRTYDWIVPELRLRRLIERHAQGDRIDPRAEEHVRRALNDAEIYLCLGLTKPNHRLPGQFRGCHPLVVGLHALPEPEELTS